MTEYYMKIIVSIIVLRIIAKIQKAAFALNQISTTVQFAMNSELFVINVQMTINYKLII